MAQQVPGPFDFSDESFKGLYPMPFENIAEHSMRLIQWGHQPGEDSSMFLFDGNIQSIQNFLEPICMVIRSDELFYEELDGINCIGTYFDMIPREVTTEYKFFQIIIGERRGDKGIYLASYPVTLDTEIFEFAPCSAWPVRLIHLIPAEDRKGRYAGAWAVVDKDFDGADDIISSFQHATTDLGTLLLSGGEDRVHMVGQISLSESQVPESEKMSAQDTFEVFLYSCKANTMVDMQVPSFAKQAKQALRLLRERMETIFLTCANKLQVFMLRHPEDFVGMADPMEELLGNGMAYTGMTFSEQFIIVQYVCKSISFACAHIRNQLQNVTDQLDLFDYEVCPWNSKSPESIFTKITDYAAKRLDPTTLSACGLLGIKDYVRTRLIVSDGKDARMCVDDYLCKMREQGAELECPIYKDKSFRFKPDGQAIYVTGIIMWAMGDMCDAIMNAYKEEGNGGDFSYYFCKSVRNGSDREDGRWGFPFEIQVVNQAALDFIEAAHHSYEIRRVSQRISAVCHCTKDSKGDPVPQLQCGHCMYRRSLGLGDCPFCHICFNSHKQQKNCTLPCCVGGTGVKLEALYKDVEDMNVDDLRKAVLELRAKEIAQRVERSQGERKKLIQKKFSAYDTNGDGTISREEFGSFFSKCGGDLSDRALDEVFAAVDKYGDGSIDYNEFVEWVMK